MPTAVGGVDVAALVTRLRDRDRFPVHGERATRGAVKVVADASTGRVLGVHAVAYGVGDKMLAATYAIKAGLTIDDLADTWAPYVTMAWNGKPGRC